MKLAGTVSVMSDSKTVTGKGTTFTQTAEVGQWLMFDSDTSRKLYKIDAIGNDTSLTLALPYVGASAPSTGVMLLRRTTISKSIADILAMPLTSETQADNFIIEMKGLKWGLVGERRELDVPVFANWQVAGYLERPENQRKEGWPEVLGIWCRTYNDLLTANMMLDCLANQKTLDRLLIETQETNNLSLPNLPPKAKQKCHSALQNLSWLAKELRRSWESDKEEMLKIVKKVRPAARERGTYAHVGYYANGYALYIASGSGSKKDALTWNYKDNTAWLTERGISIHIPNAEKDSFAPKYKVFTCEYDNKIGRHTLDSVKGTLSNRTQVILPRPNEKFLGVSAMALSDPLPWGLQQIYTDTSKQPTAVTLIVEYKQNNYGALYVIDEDIKSTVINWQPRLAGAKDVCALYLPPTTLPDDPDADAMTDKNAEPPGPPLLAQKTNIVYAGIPDGHDIYVVTGDASGTVGCPKKWSSYNGIEVDPNYLWVFGKGGIACATHASIIKCRQGKVARPSWIYHDFDKQFFPSAPEVTSLFPCIDGTLITSMQGNIYTADYEINRASDRIVTSSWVKRGGNAKQVIKMPIPCWSMLEILGGNLQSG